MSEGIITTRRGIWRRRRGSSWIARMTYKAWERISPPAPCDIDADRRSPAACSNGPSRLRPAEREASIGICCSCRTSPKAADHPQYFVADHHQHATHSARRLEAINACHFSDPDRLPSPPSARIRRPPKRSSADAMPREARCSARRFHLLLRCAAPPCADHLGAGPATTAAISSASAQLQPGQPGSLPWVSRIVADPPRCSASSQPANP